MTNDPPEWGGLQAAEPAAGVPAAGMVTDEEFQLLDSVGLTLDFVDNPRVLTALFGDKAEHWKAMLHALRLLREATGGKSPRVLDFTKPEHIWPKDPTDTTLYTRPGIVPHVRDDVLQIMVADTWGAWRMALDQLIRLQEADPAHAPDTLDFCFAWTAQAMLESYFGTEPPKPRKRRRSR